MVCVGLNKTGIKSIEAALQILGYNVAAFDEQMFDFLDHWNDVFHGTDLDVQRVYGKYDAAIDMPCPVFFEEILKEYPDVKVILSLRDEGSWIKARVQQWAMNQAATPVCWWYLSPTYRKLHFVDKSCLYAACGEAENLKNTNILGKRFRIHNDHVRAVVRKENLLEYNVKEGWQPLCEFLGCTIPDVSFPHKNLKGQSTKQFYSVSRYAIAVDGEIRRRQVVLGGLVAIGVALCVYYAIWVCAVL